jgi:hypothetical protein
MFLTAIFPTSLPIFFTILLPNTDQILFCHPELSSMSDDSCFHHSLFVSISDALSLSIVVLYLPMKSDEDKK